MNAQLVRLGPAEEKLIAQLRSAGATDAAEQLEQKGLPTRRVEDYHYTDLKALLRDVPEPGTNVENAGAPRFEVPGAERFSIVNGSLQHFEAPPSGVSVDVIENAVLSERDDVLVRLNSSLAKKALKLDIAGEIAPVIHIDRRIEGASGHIADGAKIVIGDNAKAVIVESFSGSDEAHLGNHASFLDIGKGAEITHVLIDVSGRSARHFASVEYAVGEETRLTSLVLNAGSALSRTQIFTAMRGGGAHAEFRGLSMIGEGQHSDITLLLCHEVANSTSAETYKTVGRGRARGVFQGKIVVARDAQKTDAKMMANGLMLSAETEIFAKPELEIFADDVVCGHGSTFGSLNEEHLFYLMSRGISRNQAEAMLVRAFIDSAFEDVIEGSLYDVLTGLAEDWLQRGWA